MYSIDTVDTYVSEAFYCRQYILNTYHILSTTMYIKIDFIYSLSLLNERDQFNTFMFNYI